MKKILLAFAISALTILSACGGPEFDSSSDQAFSDSVDAMSESLSGQDLELFKACMEHEKMKAISAALDGDKSAAQAVYDELDGMNVNEFFNFCAKEARK